MCVADETWRLQRGSDAECVQFQRMADQGHYGGKSGTRQGIYVCTPEGQLLSSVNSLDPAVVRSTLEGGLEAWERLARPAQPIQSGRGAAAAATFSERRRWEDGFPVEGLVLFSCNRTLPDARTPPPASPAGRWNVDHVWFNHAEARQWLPNSLQVGARRELPSSIVERLARFHLVDSVGGQTLPFAVEELEHCAITTQVVDRDRNEVTLLITGSTAAEADGEWRMGDNDWRPQRPWPRGIETELMGEAIYDAAKQRFVMFKMVAVGRWHGGTEFNGRSESESGAIGFVFALGTDTPAGRVAPAFVDVYDAPWLQAPR